MPRGDDLIHLLLAQADDRRPALPDGLPFAAAMAPSAVDPWHAAPAAAPVAGDTPDDVRFEDAPPLGAPPRELWGIIAPEGPEGDRLIALIEPLIRIREAQQNAPAPVHRVPKIERPWSMMDALEWRRERYDSGADLGRDRAVTQLILGDLTDVPLAVQQAQSLDGRVGRLAFDDDAGYEAYAEKVVRAEHRKPVMGRILMHTAHDGSPALDVGSQGLALPGEATLRAEILKSALAASAFLSHAERGVTGMDLLLDRAADPTPGVLFTLSHGLGAPRDGWTSREAQRADQGAMFFGFEGQLTGRDLEKQPFMPGGLWLMFACFGAGTPDTSAYASWLTRMEAFGRRAPNVRRNLSMGAPFIADLPKRALASPTGPIGFVGHVDLAWTFSFRDEDDPKASRAGRFMRVLASALSGEPLGAAFHALARFVAETDAQLTHAYDVDGAIDADQRAAVELRRSLLWMARQDLAGFILLGDPGARLPVQQLALAMAPPVDLALAFTQIERAIGVVLATGRSTADVAAELGVVASTLELCVATYRRAGRRALGFDG